VEAKVAKAAKAAEARTLTDDMLAEADFAGRIPTRADLQNHLINAQISGKQISGGHNLVNFENTLQGAGQIVSKIEIAPGVYEIEYKLANKNYVSNGVEVLPKKTVYDPAVYSDSKMSSMATEAAARAQIQFQVTGKTEQYVKVGDIWFFSPVNIDKVTGTVNGIRTVFPRVPPGVNQ
jgi:filamentous hemagglutinin